MSLSFTEYLIEQNLLSTDQVVEAMLIQLKTQPSNSELVYDLGIFSNNNFLKILLNQQMANSDFITSAKNLGLWSQEIEEKLVKKIKNLEPKLGDILIQKGYIEFEKISSAFNSFIEEKNSKSSIKSEKKPTPTVTGKQTIPPQMLKEYVDCFEGAVYPNIQSKLLELDIEKISPENFKIILKKIEREFITAKAASEFINADKSLEISVFMIKLIQKNINKNNIDDIEKIKNNIKMSLMILNNYCNNLKNSQNELDLNQESKDLLKQLMNNLSEKE
jgi:hypothetical protein